MGQIICPSFQSANLAELKEEIKFNQVIISIYTGQIYEEPYDSIIIPNNTLLNKEDGISGIIIKHANPEKIKEELSKNREISLKNGNCIKTTGGDLKTDHLIHIILPDKFANKDEMGQILKQGIFSSLDLACELKSQVIGIPPLFYFGRK